jgi:hypothetical protein
MGGREMRMDGQTVRRSEMVIPHLDVESVKEWAKETFTRERIADIGVVVATLVVTGYLGAVLFKGLQSYSISGF